jgi:tetratricopeptide (TPR) repeat protein
MKCLLLFSFTFSTLFSNAQNEVALFPVASPMGHISQIIGNTKLEIEYERPLARKREIFGELVPWNQVWRTGAGASTKIKISKAAVVEGQSIPPGRYSLFTIPGADTWVVILNSDTTLYGTYGYDRAKDIARFVVTPKLSHRFYEALTIDVDLVQSNARLYLSWTNIQIDFSIATTTASDASKFIEQQLLTEKNKKSDAYYEAAQYLFFERSNLKQGLKLADKALELDKNNGAARRVKMEIYEYLGMFDEALIEISHALEMEKNKPYEKEADRTSETKYWLKHQARIKGKRNRSVNE